MGWDSSPSWRSKQDVIQSIVRDYGSRVVKYAPTASGAWAIMRHHSESAPAFVILFLIENEGGWAYKAISESEGPCYYDCPVSFLEETFPPPGTYAEKWRKEVLRRAGQS